MQDLDIIIQSELLTLKVIDQTTLEQATATLSTLNTQLDAITAHKEAKTKPLNEALKKIRQDYKPYEDQLTTAIASIRLAITSYATEHANIAKQQETKILADKRTSTATKINALSNIENSTQKKVSTDVGDITFITVKKYKVTDETKIPRTYLTLDETKIKEAMKQSPQPQISGIEWYEEKSLRNYR